MYPFQSNETFVRNAWYVAAVASEIDAGPLQRTILGEPVALFRGESGDVHAMHALCPHRSYPLALRGRVVGEAIQCAYHGFMFDGGDGSCVHVPSQERPPSQHRQRVYPVHERGPWIWIWPGDSDLADESAIPSLDEVGLGDGWAHAEMIRFIGIKGRYMLLVENLFDLTHVDYLHGDMSDFGEVSRTPVAIEETEERMTATRTMRTPWTKFHEALFGAENRFDGMSEYDARTRYHGPGYINTTGHIMHSIEGHEVVDPAKYGIVHFHHAITPETTTSCHYFGGHSRNFRLTETEYFNGPFRDFDILVRQQDVDAAEAIEAHMQEFGEPKVELMVKSDTAAGRARRRIQRLINLEDAEGDMAREPAGQLIG